VNARLHQNKAEFAVNVLAVLVEVSSDVHRLLDQVVEILRQLGAQALRLEDAQDLGVCDGLHMRDPHGVTQDDTDLARSQALLGILDDFLLDLVGLDLAPAGRRPLVGQRRARNTLTRSVHAPHV